MWLSGTAVDDARHKPLKAWRHDLSCGMEDDLTGLTAEIRTFVHAREWQRFHNPKNLALALVAEVGELVEHFQWLTPEEADTVEGEKLAAVADEIADVQLYLMQLADRLGVDIGAAVREKLARNEVRFPVR